MASPLDALLMSFDKALADPYESLAASLHDLDHDAITWQHPAWADEPHDQGVGVPGTILWHLNHLEMCHRHYIATLLALNPDAAPRTELPGELGFAEIQSALEAANRELRATIAGMSAEDLAKHARPSRSVANFVAMITRHIVWHAAQITLVRRLWSTRQR